MGADIHPFLEVKVCGKWRFIPLSLQSDRDYELFGMLSGVRGEGPPFARVLKDLEKDASEEVRQAWDGGEWGHTPTIVSCEDIEAILHEKSDAYVRGWLQVMEDMMKLGVEDVRVILWYDS